MQQVRTEKVEFIRLESARNNLSAVWLFGALIVFIPLFVQSMLGHYGESVDVVWSWFIPTCLPTVSLMIGVLGATAFDNNEKRRVKLVFFRIALGISIVYLSILLLTILLAPFSKSEPVDVLKMSGNFVSPIQGIAVAVIGYLFTAQSSDDRASSGKAE